MHADREYLAVRVKGITSLPFPSPASDGGTLCAQGIYENQWVSIVNKTIFFEEPARRVVSGRDVTEYVFSFRLVDSTLVGSPEESSRSSFRSIKVAVTRTLSACWGFITDDELHRVMFEYGKRHVVQKIIDGTLGEFEEIDLHTANAECPCPFDPKKIENPIGAIVKLESSSKKIMEDSSTLQLASAIIDARDNINAIFHQTYKEKLILLGEERDLLQFFRDAQSEEEFFFRSSALANAATKLNIPCLRKLTGITDTQVKSIQLLETYLNNFNVATHHVIDTLRNINKLRQSYPVHGDRSKGVLQAYTFFSLEYPIVKYSESWKKLLSKYLEALKNLLELLKKLDINSHNQANAADS